MIKTRYEEENKFFSPSLCHNIYNTSSLKIHPLASCKFYGYQKEIDIMDGLNSYRCSNVSGMSKVFFFSSSSKFSRKYERHFSSLVSIN